MKNRMNPMIPMMWDGACASSSATATTVAKVKGDEPFAGVAGEQGNVFTEVLLAPLRTPSVRRPRRNPRNMSAKFRSVGAVLVLAIACASFFTVLPDATAAQVNLDGPAGSGLFGTNVTSLPNGNFVVTDPGYDAPGPIVNVGAVYLYDGVTLAIISSLTGSTANDAVGNGGVMVLSNGNFVVSSTSWNASRGAVTWCSATAGVNGAVSAANSLVGTTAGDQVGAPTAGPQPFFAPVPSLTALNNGNYVVRSPSWDSGAVINAGAVTWGSGTVGVSGEVSSANSLVGSAANDGIGSGGVTALNNGSYVVSSSSWNGVRGAATWGSGTAGVSGTVSPANSLVGTTAGDSVGGGVTALNNGNYVVTSSGWDNGAVTDAGAATWGSGTVGVSGAVSAANSLVGTTASDNVGGGVTALSNGNYVVRSPNWDDGAVANVGAVTWGNGTTGVSGAISSANSLVGSTASDSVGNGAVTALNNGNYVVTSASVGGGRGAVTWGNGLGGTVGSISPANSLVGSTANDLIGISGVIPLNNGNYVVCSSSWDNPVGPVVNVGAATWGNGLGGTVGAISSANSLIGSTASDGIGSGVNALSNGNYVVRSPGWSSSRGAVTWGGGLGGTVGVVSPGNSLVGSTASDSVGSSVTALSNGNYVASSPNWNGLRGAVTWGNGLGGTVGTVSAGNSLIGSTASDSVGSGVTALSNGNYVVNSLNWDNGVVVNAGAVTWGNGLGGTAGAVSTANSLVGSTANDAVGSGSVFALNNGNYVVNSFNWDNPAGPVVNVGAVTWGNGLGGTAGAVSAVNSLVGSTANDAVGNGSVTTLGNGNYVVRSTAWHNGVVISAGAVTLGNGTLGSSGAVAAGNSVLGTVAGGGSSMVFAYDLLNTRLLAGYPAANRVSLFSPAPEIAVEQPLNVNLVDGASKGFGGVAVGANVSLIFIIKNIGSVDLTGLGVTIDGSDAALFNLTASPAAPVSGPSGSTSFTVTFAPTTAGLKNAALHIASNDADENPFDINLSGQGLVFTQDTDGDGMSDAAELQWSALGFDWQVSQPGLVTSFFANASNAGLYTTSQIQALNVGRVLIQRNAATGQFTLTMSVQKSTDLINFDPLPMTAPQTTINAQGALEFQFSVADDAAFFLLESK